MDGYFANMQWDWCTWSSSVALDFILVVGQLHRQAKVGDTNVAYGSKKVPPVTNTQVCPTFVSLTHMCGPQRQQRERCVHVPVTPGASFFTLIIQQYILWFEIPVDDPLLVEVLHALDDLSGVVAGPRLAETGVVLIHVVDVIPGS